MTKKRNGVRQGNGPVYVDMVTGEVHYGGILRSDHVEKTLAELKESEREYEKRKRNWERADKLWVTGAITAIIGSLLSSVLLVIVVVNALAHCISPIIVMICGVIVGIMVIATTVQVVAAKILERS